MAGIREGGARLGTARRRLERWRERHGGPGRPIPPELWDEAAEVARVEGVGATARALRIDRRRLAERLASAAEPEVEAAEPEPAALGVVAGTGAAVAAAGDDGTGRFVRLDVSELWPAGQTVLRFEGADGERLGVEVSGGTTVDLLALALAFWSRSR